MQVRLRVNYLRARDEGCAHRTCAICRAKHHMCDSAEYWEEAQPQRVYLHRMPMQILQSGSRLLAL